MQVASGPDRSDNNEVEASQERGDAAAADKSRDRTTLPSGSRLAAS